MVALSGGSALLRESYLSSNALAGGYARGLSSSVEVRPSPCMHSIIESFAIFVYLFM